jgi:formamidopyrimidine-DNA glycosylase
MPELPEVEVSRLGISPFLLNQTLCKVIVRETRLRWPVPSDIQQLKDAPILGVSRRAKYLLIQVPGGDIILHLGMSGKLRVIDSHTPLIKHDHIDFVLSSDKCLRFNDPRRFGACLWQPEGECLTQLQSLGPEPLTHDFDAKRLFELSRQKKVAVKNFIMDNHVVVGVGNIYANEALFLSGIDPRRAAGRISQKRYERLAENIKLVLTQAIEQGGTTLKDFANADGNPGYFSQYLRVYGRAGEPCRVCDTALKSVTIGQRNTFYCPQCQK